MATAFVDLTWTDGQDNMGGVKSSGIYFAPGSYFDVAPDLLASPATNTEAVTIAVAPTFATGKHWLKFYTTMNTAEIKDAGVGEIDGHSSESTFEFFYPGTKTECLAFVKLVQNTNMFFVVDQANGVKRQFGSTAFPAKLDSYEGTSGKKNNDRPGFTFKFKTQGNTPAPICTYALALS